MDTKWNSMDNDPGEGLENFVAQEVRAAVEPSPGAARGERDGSAGRRLRAAAAFLAFFLGVSLVVGSLGAAVGRLAWQRDAGTWWQDDWQETQAFRDTVSGYLETFLTLGAGGTLDWYNWAVAQEYGFDSVYEGRGGWVFSSSVPASDYASTVVLEAAAWDAKLRANPDYEYKSDKNVLYRVRKTVGNTGYSNVEPTETLSAYETLPEGYNFLLTFENGKARAWKDGVELDLYGSGIYNGESLWYIPGYENFPAGEDVADVKVSMAVRKVPAQYFQGDYANGSVEQNNRMYWLYRDLQQSRSFYRAAAIALAAGLVLLGAGIALRKYRAAADRKIAAVTVHIWTEARFLAVAACLAGLLLDGIWSTDWYYELLYEGLHSYMLYSLLRSLLGILDNVPALLGLWWVVWLIHNDHRYNPKAERRSLMKLVSVRTRKYSFQQRMTWRNHIALILSCLPAVAWLLALPRSMGVSAYGPLFWAAMIPLCLLAVFLLLILRKNAGLARDTGLLADQVEAIRDGDLTAPMEMPQDSDLLITAEHLNDIQSGMRKALEEQTRSERMKVELISNVSHDLKTPLTSILSYAELLRQEDLSPAAADYARIIDEKAQRLKTMVQDVFDVSKATADQLPVQLERLDLGKLLRQTLADMADPIAVSRLTFKTDLPEEPVLVVADGKRLYRVFQNLIQNALQYALEGSRVYLTLAARAGKAEASVRNTSRWELASGVDFTARFVRGDESRTDGGSGLGLSIASSFTEACGGEFRVETVADLFTAVVTFPLAEH